MRYLIAADPSATRPLSSTVARLGGKPLSACAWIVTWHGTADALCRELRLQTVQRCVVCALSGDWSYR